jgi:hypothetical protein
MIYPIGSYNPFEARSLPVAYSSANYKMALPRISGCWERGLDGVTLTMVYGSAIDLVDRISRS